MGENGLTRGETLGCAQAWLSRARLHMNRTHPVLPVTRARSLRSKSLRGTLFFKEARACGQMIYERAQMTPSARPREPSYL